MRTTEFILYRLQGQWSYKTKENNQRNGPLSHFGCTSNQYLSIRQLVQGITSKKNFTDGYRKIKETCNVYEP
jgi:hypothetical protein